MRRIINFLNLFFVLGFATSAQCDVNLMGYDPITGDISIEIINGENCGCNEFTSPGTTCDESASSVVNNNETVSHFVFGLHYDDVFENTDCTNTNYHPGWTYASIQDYFGGWETGEIVNFNINDAAWAGNWDCILNNPIEGECWELVVWQINLSMTATPDFFPTEFWTDTCGVCQYQTQVYPDVDLSNNSLIWCPDELPPSPLYPGCMDPEATNFDDTAGYDDGSCLYPAVPGCTDPVACNYDSNATENDGSCIYCDESLCAWVAPWCYGCTDPVALNYDEDSQINDGTCIYSTGPDLVPIDVIVDEAYCNQNVDGVTMFKLFVTVTNIGTEEVVDWCGSTFLTPSTWQCPNVDLMPGDTVMVEMNFAATWISGQSNYLDIDFVEGPNGSQEIITGNNILAGWNMPEFIDCSSPIAGCMDECALNYNPVATEDDGSCEYYTITDTVYVELPPDTILTYILQIDSIFTTLYDTIYVELPPDTLIEYVDNFVYDTIYVELPPDTLIETEYVTDTLIVIETEYVYDTLFVDNYIYQYDTIYVDVPVIDTLYITETEYVTDTLFVTEYITLTDTITEYIVQELWIDCNTGLPCEEDPPGFDCPDWTTIHIPNTFTPNNDGFNDVWKIIYDLYCWEDVEFWVYNRWGEEIYHAYGSSFDSYPFWDGSVRGGDHYVSDGVYIYVVQGKKVGRAEVVKKQGHITVFR